MNTTPSEVVTGFVSAFDSRDARQLAPFLHPDVDFQAYGDDIVHGRESVVSVWDNVFRAMEKVEFSTIHQAVNGDIVVEEQIHGLALPGRQLAPIRNMAVYRVKDGQIIEWRDYSNPQYAQTLL